VPEARLSFLSSSVRPFVLLLALPAAALNGSLVAAWGELKGGPAQTPPGQSGDRATERRAATRPAARVISRTTPHLAFAATLSPEIIGPGTRASIVIDVTPKKGMHVYAPGSIYRPIAIAVEPNSLLRVHDPVYPKPTLYVFKPLNEEVLVYSAPFRIVLDITAGDTAADQARLRARSRLTIKGKLDYQACDETVCYLPTSVPLEWTVRVKR
jgi:DsbC/DsbD-like thiol-disulfide interchange protein